MAHRPQVASEMQCENNIQTGYHCNNLLARCNEPAAPMMDHHQMSSPHDTGHLLCPETHMDKATNSSPTPAKPGPPEEACSLGARRAALHPWYFSDGAISGWVDQIIPQEPSPSQREFERSTGGSPAPDFEKMRHDHRAEHSLMNLTASPELLQGFPSNLHSDIPRSQDHQEYAVIWFPDGLLADIDRIDGIFHCPHCLYRAIDTQRLQNHADVMHVDLFQSLECIRCSLGFADRAVEEYHCRTVHRRRAKVYYGDRSYRIAERRNGRFNCMQCLFATVDPEKLNLHTTFLHETNTDVQSADAAAAHGDHDLGSTLPKVKRRKPDEQSSSTEVISMRRIFPEQSHTSSFTELGMLPTPPVTPESAHRVLEGATVALRVFEDRTLTPDTCAPPTSEPCHVARWTAFLDGDALLDEYSQCSPSVMQPEGGGIDFDEWVDLDVGLFG